MMMFLTVAVLMMALVGCGRPSEPNSGNKSDTVFEIVSYTPKSGATVFPDTVIQITPTIGVSIDCASLHTGVVFIPVLTGNWMCDEDVATFHSFYSLPEGVQNVSVKTSVRGTNGEVLGHAVEWSFNVSVSVPSGNHAPRIVYQSPNQTNFPGREAVFTFRGEDIDGDSLQPVCVWELSSVSPLAFSVVMKNSMTAEARFTLPSAINGRYQLACQLNDGKTTSNVVLLEAVGTNMAGTSPMAFVTGPSDLYVNSSSTAVASYSNNHLSISRLGDVRWYIQLFWRPMPIVLGETYEVTIQCSGGGYYDVLLQHDGEPYSHYDEKNNAVACDGERVLYILANVTDIKARLSVMMRQIGEFFISASYKRVL